MKKVINYNFKRKNCVTSSSIKRCNLGYVRKCHLCEKEVRYNWVLGNFNYRIGDLVFCSWKCIQQFRRDNNLIKENNLCSD